MKKITVADFSKLKYGSKEWNALSNYVDSHPHSLTKFIPASGGITEVKRGKLFHNGKEVFRNKRPMGHPIVFKDLSFAMTESYFDAMKRHLKHFKVKTLKWKRRRGRI